MIETHYCPKCHREAFRVVKNEAGIKVTQNGHTLLTLNETSSVSMKLKCPAGHSVLLELGKSQKTKKTRIKKADTVGTETKGTRIKKTGTRRTSIKKAETQMQTIKLGGNDEH